MRLLIVGSLGGQISAATKIAMDQGAKVAHVDTVEQATSALRAGRGADLLMVDARLDIAALIAANEAEHIVVDPHQTALAHGGDGLFEGEGLGSFF